MKRMLSLLLCVAVLMSLSACLSPSGSTLEQKRESIERMHNETLAQLYRQRPTAENVLSKAVGYAVFSNVNAYLFFGGGGAGYGVAVDQSSGQRTYMKMAQAGIGLGLGLQDIRAVFVFHSAGLSTILSITVGNSAVRPTRQPRPERRAAQSPVNSRSTPRRPCTPCLNRA